MLPDDYMEPAENGKKTVKSFPNPDTQFKGQPGPGRPKGSLNRSTLFRQWMDMEVEGESNEKRIMRALMLKAQEGDVSAIKEALDSTFGKLTDKQELTGANGEPLQAIVRKVVDPKNNDNT